MTSPPTGPEVGAGRRVGELPGAAPPAEPTSARARRVRWWGGLAVAAALLGLTVLATVLRVGPLGPPSLWLDDAWVALVWRTDGWDDLRRVGFSAPGFALLLRAWFALVGFSETNAQLLALVAGVVTTPAAYLVARRLGQRPVVALLPAALLTASPIAVTYATRVKQYTWEGLLALGLTALAVWVLAEVGSPRRWGVFVAAGAVATTVSAFLAPTVAAGLAAGVVVAWRTGQPAGVTRRRALGTVLAAGVAYGALALGWYLLVLAPAITTAISGFWAEHYLVVDAGPRAALASLWAAAVGVAEGFSAVPAPVTFGVVLLAAIATLRERPEVAVLLLVPTAVAVVLAALQLAPLGGGRTDLYLYPSLSLLVGVGAEVLLARMRARRQRGTPAVLARTGVVAARSLVAVLIVGALAAARPPADYPVYDVAPLVAEVDQRRADGEVLLVYSATRWAHALYTDRAVALTDDPTSAWGFTPVVDDVIVLPPGRDDPAAYEPTVAALADSDVEVIWLLASHWRDDLDALGDQLRDAGYVEVERSERPGARLTRWERT